MLKLTSNAFNFLWRDYRAVLLRDIARDLAYVFFSGCVFLAAICQSAYAENSGGIIKEINLIGGKEAYVGTASSSGYTVKVTSTTNEDSGDSIRGVFGADGDIGNQPINVTINLEHEDDYLWVVSGLYDALGNYNLSAEKTVTIENGTITSFIYGAHTSSAFNGELSNSKVEINNIKFTGSGIIGAILSSPNSVSNVHDNSIIINDGVYKSQSNLLYIAGAHIWKIAENNKVEIYGGDITGNIYGAVAADSNATISSNTVTLAGGTISGSIYAGGSYSYYSDLTFENNSIVLDYTLENTRSAQELNLTNAALYGYPNVLTPKSINGNTLEVHHSGYVVQSVQNFNVYRFIIEEADLDSITGDQSSPLLKVTGGSNTNLEGSRIEVEDKSSLTGNSIVLLENQNGIIEFTKSSGTKTIGVAKQVDYTISLSDNNTKLIYSVETLPAPDLDPNPDPQPPEDDTSEPTPPEDSTTDLPLPEENTPDIDFSHPRPAVRLNPQVKALAEANLGSAAAVVQSSSFAAQQGMGAALQAISRTKQQNAMQAARVYATQVNVGETGSIMNGGATGNVLHSSQSGNVINNGQAGNFVNSGTNPAISQNYTGTAGTTGITDSSGTTTTSSNASSINTNNNSSPVTASIGSDSVIAGFGVIGGSKTRMNTGSHIDNDTVSLMAGLAVSCFFENVQWTFGAFLEHGEGSYDTYNSFPDAASVHGSGDTDYTGLGILSRFDFTEFDLNSTSANVFLEGSLRAGRIHNEYSNGDLIDANNTAAAFSNSSSYYSFHVGTGLDINLNDNWLLTLGAQYFYTHQGSSSAELSTGEHMEFDSVVSQRARLHGRLSWQATSSIQPYVGIAFEHEFDGTADSTIDGMRIESPSLGGNTWMGEMGLSVLASHTLPLHVNLGVQGYTGFMEGVTGSLQVLWRF